VKIGCRLPHRKDKGHQGGIDAFISAIIDESDVADSFG